MMESKDTLPFRDCGFRASGIRIEQSTGSVIPKCVGPREGDEGGERLQGETYMIARKIGW